MNVRPGPDPALGELLEALLRQTAFEDRLASDSSRLCAALR